MDVRWGPPGRCAQQPQKLTDTSMRPSRTPAPSVSIWLNLRGARAGRVEVERVRWGAAGPRSSSQLPGLPAASSGSPQPRHLASSAGSEEAHPMGSMSTPPVPHMSTISMTTEAPVRRLVTRAQRPHLSWLMPPLAQ